MTQRVFYRELIVGDEEALAALCGELGYQSTTREVVERMKQFVDHPEHVILVAADATEKPIGWIHAFVAHRVESDAFAELGGLVVAEDRRGEGIGSRLVKLAEEWATSQGIASIRVRSNIIRERTHRFYLDAGYSQTKSQHVFQKALRKP
jgi:GNAT superfamily N-acetyltransferase